MNKEILAKLCIVLSLIFIMICSGCIDSTIDVSKKEGLDENGDDTQTTINWLTRWKDEHLRETLIHEIAQEFEFENPDIDVNWDK